SQSRRSGASASTIRSAEAPSLAVPTSDTLSCCPARICSRSIASGSSSTIRVLSVWVMSAAFAGERQPQRDEEAAVVRAAPFAARRGAIAGQEALADVAETHAGAGLGHRNRRVDVILDAQQEEAIFVARGEANADLSLARRNAIFERILDDRLEDQHRDAGAF